MLRLRWMVFAIVMFLNVLPATVLAESLPLHSSLRLGRPARSRAVSVNDEADTVTLRVADRAHTLPARGAKAASVELFAVTDDAAVAIVRVSAQNGEWAALLGGSHGDELLFVGRTDMHGDLGERRAHEIHATPRSGAGPSALSVSTRFEGITQCGADEPWQVDPRTLDAKTLQLVATAPTLTLRAAPITVEPSPTSESALTAQVVHALVPVATTHSDEITELPQVPRALSDERSDTSWQPAPHEAALLRWATPTLPIERISVLFGTTPASPAALHIVTEHAVLRVPVAKPETSPALTFAFPEPLTTRCLALLWSDVKHGNPPAIAELRLGTALDQPEGWSPLIAALVQDSDQAATATELLSQVGPAAAHTLANRFAELSVRGQRRALRVFASALSSPEIIAKVASAARAEDPELREAALNMLARGKEPGLAALRELALLNEPAGDGAVRVLSLRNNETRALLAVLATDNGMERLGVRRALVASARHDGPAFEREVQRWLGAERPPAHAQLSVIVIAAAAGRKDLAVHNAEAILTEIQGFSERFRMCAAALDLAPSTTIDHWLVGQANSAEEWMIRRAAFDALWTRAPAEALRIAERLAHDAYPRVRAATTRALAKAGKLEALEQLARKDAWPIVRGASAEALAVLPSARPTLERLLDDSSRQVRVAAIQSLSTQGARASWPLIERRLRAPQEWPEVQTAAVQYAGSLCVQAARPHLTHLARRGLRADANDDERKLGVVALHALHDLGGTAADDAKLLASRELSHAELQATLANLGPPHCSGATSSP